MIILKEIVGLEFIQRDIQHVVIQQDGAEHGALGFGILRAGGVRWEGCGHKRFFRNSFEFALFSPKQRAFTRQSRLPLRVAGMSHLFAEKVVHNAIAGAEEIAYSLWKTSECELAVKNRWKRPEKSFWSPAARLNCSGCGFALDDDFELAGHVTVELDGDLIFAQSADRLIELNFALVHGMAAAAKVPARDRRK